MLVENKLIILSLTALFLAQFLKIPFGYISNKKFDLTRLFETGGMPSSHSAFVVSLAIGIGRTTGFASPIFALSFVFASIVMYDAIGIRRAAGEHAKILNLMLSNDNKFTFNHKKLKELLGHTPFEVLGGTLLGILVGILFPL
ncbi:divergent PAP2 family protein [Eubacterium multiforme]|uniref:Acid phosphatase family membrane protein YuiD n=1 Tax=Eubacterium multiforme TaxID=83339 RepID=A0ABT9US08_9FIRM|nr:acid phosphatase family membrane protein YuiD [Eubacterium multiforme]